MRYDILSFIAGVILGLGVAGCEQTEQAAEPTAQPEVTETAATPADESPQQQEKEGEVMAKLQVTSPSFAHEGAIPLEFTCDGADVSPALSWTAGPDGTASYALIMDDPDAPGRTWVHWVAWDIPQPSLVDAIPAQEALDDGTMQGMNSWQRLGYGGPCPPSGTHRYYFKVYALDAKLDLPASTDKEALLEAMEGHILAQGELMGTYQR